MPSRLAAYNAHADAPCVQVTSDRADRPQCVTQGFQPPGSDIQVDTTHDPDLSGLLPHLFTRLYRDNEASRGSFATIAGIRVVALFGRYSYTIPTTDDHFTDLSRLLIRKRSGHPSRVAGRGAVL